MYVIGYDVYLLNTTESSSPIPITNTGTEDGTRYGIPDWVYEGSQVQCIACVLCDITCIIIKT